MDLSKVTDMDLIAEVLRRRILIADGPIEVHGTGHHAGHYTLSYNGPSK